MTMHNEIFLIMHISTVLVAENLFLSLSMYHQAAINCSHFTKVILDWDSMKIFWPHKSETVFILFTYMNENKVVFNLCVVIICMKKNPFLRREIYGLTAKKRNTK